MLKLKTEGTRRVPCASRASLSDFPFSFGLDRGHQGAGFYTLHHHYLLLLLLLLLLTASASLL